MDLRTCPNCGLRHARGEDVDPCASCLLDGWAVGLGRAIRRFVRRAEVERLIIDVLDGIMPPTSLDERQTARHALDRLAALAMEVEP